MKKPILFRLLLPVLFMVSTVTVNAQSPNAVTARTLTEKGVWVFEMAAPTLMFYDMAREGKPLLGNMLFRLNFTDFVYLYSGLNPFHLTFEGGLGTPPLVSASPDYPGVETRDSEEGESPYTFGFMVTAYAGAGLQWITDHLLLTLTAGPGAQFGMLLSDGSRQPEGESMAFAYGAVNLKTGFLFDGLSINLDTRFGYGWGIHEWVCDEEISSGFDGTSDMEGLFLEFSVSLAFWPSWEQE